ncbi:endonuclease/exonuclease/phosphatase family protein [Echinicola sediminis]
MKIVSWNCNGAFRKKFHLLDELYADILIIQECENPSCTKDQNYQNWASNYLWIGDNKNKGLGVFADPSIKLENLNWSNAYQDHFVKYFLPCSINDQFNLLGVWAHHNNSPNFGYNGQLWKYLEINIHAFTNIIIGGDLNSNCIWDQWDRWWNHSDIIRSLASKNINSVYHSWHTEEQGKESTPTFFLQRKAEKPYHIDYFFASKNLLDSIKHFEVLTDDKWLDVSDHRPLLMKLN